MKLSPKIWVGYLASNPGQMAVFRSFDEPTRETHGGKYLAAIGPFRTVRGAAYMVRHGKGNPHCVTVRDAERLALIHKGQSELCRAYSEHLSRRIAASR